MHNVSYTQPLYFVVFFCFSAGLQAQIGSVWDDMSIDHHHGYHPDLGALHDPSKLYQSTSKSVLETGTGKMKGTNLQVQTWLLREIGRNYSLAAKSPQPHL